MARILIMEDDFDLVDQWTETLESNGHDVTRTRSCSQAEEVCRQMQFDLAVVDLYVADSDGRLIPDGGLLLISHLRAPLLADTPDWGVDVPILAVTGGVRMPGFDPIEYATHAGADLALAKPVPATALTAAVSKLLDRPASPPRGCAT